MTLSLTTTFQYRTHKRERWWERTRKTETVLLCGGDKVYYIALRSAQKTTILFRENAFFFFFEEGEPKWLRSVKCSSLKQKQFVTSQIAGWTCRMQVPFGSYTTEAFANCNNQAALYSSGLLFVNSAMASSGHICMKLTCLNNHKTFMQKNKKTKTAALLLYPYHHSRIHLGSPLKISHYSFCGRIVRGSGCRWSEGWI